MERITLHYGIIQTNLMIPLIKMKVHFDNFIEIQK